MNNNLKVTAELEYDFEDFEINYNVDCSDFTLRLNNFLNSHSDKTVRKTEITNCYVQKYSIDTLINNLEKEHFIAHCSKNEIIFYRKDCLIHFSYADKDGLDGGSFFHTNACDIDYLKEVVTKSIDNTKKLEIRWFIDERGDYYDIVDVIDDTTTDTMYPFIKDGVENYIDKFLKSKASILILYGEPGTGKTNFIRNILAKMNKRACLSFNENVFKTDAAFAEFMTNKRTSCFVIEDADLLIKSRDSGNELMSKFLNIGDGIIKMNGRKLIFSTNLPTIKDIDSALMRPGRCYDVLNFRKLKFHEAEALCIERELPMVTEEKEYTLSEVFNQTPIEIKRAFGFI